MYMDTSDSCAARKVDPVRQPLSGDYVAPLPCDWCEADAVDHAAHAVEDPAGHRGMIGLSRVGACEDHRHLLRHFPLKRSTLPRVVIRKADVPRLRRMVVA